MTRLARMVIAGLPHHVTQRGNRREAIFFEDGDHEIYRNLLAEQTRKAGVEVWAYCLMPNHVHLALTPKRADGLGLAVSPQYMAGAVKKLDDVFAIALPKPKDQQ
jgi:putative transposase